MAFSDLLAASQRQPYLNGTVTCLTGAVVPFSGSQAVGFSLSEGGGSLLGGAFSASCQLTLANDALPDGVSPYGAQVRVNLALGDESAPLAVFTVTRVIRRENDPRLILQGFDALGTAFEGEFQDSFSYPRTLGQLAQGIAAQAGFSLSADFPNASFRIPAAPDWGDISLRQALAYVACAAGCLAVISRSGRLQFKPVNAAADPLPLQPDVTLKHEYGDAAFGPLKALTIRLKNAPRGASPLVVTQDGAAAGSQNGLSISGNPLFPYGGSHTKALANALLNELQGYTVQQLRVIWRGNPSLTLGDRVRVTDASGISRLSSVTGQSLVFSRGFSMQSDCEPPRVSSGAGKLFTSSGALNAARLEGSLNGVMIRDGSIAASALMAGSVTAHQLAAGAVTAEKISAGAVTADQIGTGAVTADKISAGAVESRHLAAETVNALYARLAQADIEWAEIEDLHAAIADIANAQISTADIDWGHVKDLITGRAIITEGEAGELYIARLAVTEANMVSLTVGELVVKGEDGSFYALTVDEDGNIDTEKKEIENSDVADASIHGGEKLIEGSVTAQTLNAQDIFGDSAIIRQLIAENLDVDTLFARQATLDKINALDITGNESIRLYVENQQQISTWVRITEDGLEIGKEGDTARFQADNRTLSVANVKTERVGIAQTLDQDEEWAWIATNSGLGLKYIGPEVSA